MFCEIKFSTQWYALTFYTHTDWKPLIFVFDLQRLCFFRNYLGSVNANSGAHAGGNNSSNGNNNSNGSNANNGTAVEIEHSFGRPMVLAKLGQYIMDIKVDMCKLFYWTLQIPDASDCMIEFS